MWIVPVVSFSVLIYLVLYSPFVLFIALLFARMDIITGNCMVANRPLDSGKTKAKSPANLFFCEKYPGKPGDFLKIFRSEDNWLPPDNFQLHPITILAHRTSPTNIGLCLLANLACIRFRIYHRITTDRSNIKQHAIHAKNGKVCRPFYNWYDTVTPFSHCCQNIYHP